MVQQQMVAVADMKHHSSEFTKSKSLTTLHRRRSNKNTTTPKAVTFGSVVIHEHPIIVGCNPGVSSGVPMTIGWYAVSNSEMSLMEYEKLRVPDRVSHRLLLKQHPFERYMLLQNLGFSRQELHRAEEGAKVVRELREESFLDSVDTDDVRLRRRLKLLYEHSKEVKQRELLKQQQQQLSASKPVLRKILRRLVGVSPRIINHSYPASKRKNMIAVAAL